MKMRLEQLLNLAAATVTFAAAFGFDPAVAMLLQAAISVGLAVAGGIPR